MAPLIDLLWQRVLRRLFFRLDPETAHRMALALLAGVPPISAPADAEALGQDSGGCISPIRSDSPPELDKDVPGWRSGRCWALGSWR